MPIFLIVRIEHLLPVELVLVGEVLHLVEHLVVHVAVAVEAPDRKVREGQGERVARLAVVFHLVSVDIPVMRKKVLSGTVEDRLCDCSY